ncbi:D-aminoacyl-tRNA deacylase [Bdellovibrionota bacterium FG-2]
MRAVIQRVKTASVEIDGKRVAEIGPGLLTLLGVARGDTEAQLEKLLRKICELRIFEDDAGKMNRSLLDLSLPPGSHAHLIVSQFTLAADCTSGRRPSFTSAEEPVKAKALYEKAIELSAQWGISTQGGIFQADMKVSLVNDGPVTFVLESP